MYFNYLFFQNMNNTSIILWLLGSFWTIVTGVVTKILSDWVKENVTFASSKWPLLKGVWIILHEDGLRSGEFVEIHQQFGSKFRGELHTPNPNNDGDFFIQEIRGELRDRYHALFLIQQKENSFTEMGAGMIAIDVNQITASGKSVFFGVSSPRGEMAISVFTMKKKVER